MGRAARSHLAVAGHSASSATAHVHTRDRRDILRQRSTCERNLRPGREASRYGRIYRPTDTRLDAAIELEAIAAGLGGRCRTTRGLPGHRLLGRRRAAPVAVGASAAFRPPRGDERTPARAHRPPRSGFARELDGPHRSSTNNCAHAQEQHYMRSCNPRSGRFSSSGTCLRGRRGTSRAYGAGRPVRRRRYLNAPRQGKRGEGSVPGRRRSRTPLRTARRCGRRVT
jgi:hypothetical protein